MKGLSRRQVAILETIEESLRTKGYPPTVREIGAATKIPSTSVVAYNLKRLEDMGFIERDRSTARGLRLG